MTGGACQGCMRENERDDWHDDVNEKETEYSVLLLLLLQFLLMSLMIYGVVVFVAVVGGEEYCV